MDRNLFEEHFIQRALRLSSIGPNSITSPHTTKYTYTGIIGAPYDEGWLWCTHPRCAHQRDLFRRDWFTELTDVSSTNYCFEPEYSKGVIFELELGHH